MNIDYTFKDGVTVPLKIFANHHEADDYTSVRVFAALRDHSVQTPTDIPLNAGQAEEFGDLIKLVLRGLADRTSDEFVNNPEQSSPLIGIGDVYVKGGK